MATNNTSNSSASPLSNPLVLNYHDAVLYESDVKLLETRDSWWNDACLHFGLTCLKHENKNHDVYVMDPSVVSYLMHQCNDEEDIQEFKCANNKELLTKSVMIIPINDNHNAADECWTTVGLGTHWSLLLVVRNTSIHEYWHVDSICNSSNQKAALSVAQKLHSTIFEASSSSLEFRQLHNTPQQDNGYDCAVHALIAARAAAVYYYASSQLLLTMTAFEEALQKEFGTIGASQKCAQVRQEMAKTARRLAKEYAAEKSSSSS